MSTFTTEQLKKKWADYEDSESDREEEETSVDAHSSLGQRKKGKDNVLTEKIEKEEVEEDEEEEEEGEDEDDDDLLDLSRIKVGNSLPNQSKGEKKNLSKKEQLELKKKEMEDLETLLAQYREEVPISEVQSKEPADEKVQEKQDDNNDESKGKKKKKKKAASKSDTQTDSNTTISTDTQTPVEISAVLKSKVAKKNVSTGKKATPDPLKIAMEEALKSSNNKKKKRDKSKFNEGSY